MRRIKLDRIDRRILNDLQHDGRMTNVELAKRSGISAPPCLRRVRALEDAGFINGYHAHLNHEMLGFHVMVFAMVSLKNHHEKDISAFRQKIDEWEEVRESFMLAGENDFLLKIVAEDWDRYQKFLTHELTSWDNVAHVKSIPTIKSTKFKSGVPIDIHASYDPEEDLD